MACDKKWVPLESNPEVMNKFLSSVGVPEEYSLVDIVDTDDLDSLPQGVKAVLMLFPTSEAHVDHCDREREAIESEGQVVSDRVYFMRLETTNASGTASLIHAVANSDVQPVEESSLQSFLERTADMTPEERGQELEMDENLCCVHENLAKQGQTEAPEGDEETNLHFITFVAVDEQLYELDARKSFPINHGSTSPEALLQDAVAACRQFMERDPDSVNFSLMALVSGAPPPDIEEGEEVEADAE